MKLFAISLKQPVDFSRTYREGKLYSFKHGILNLTLPRSGIGLRSVLLVLPALASLQRSTRLIFCKEQTNRLAEACERANHEVVDACQSEHIFVGSIQKRGVLVDD